MSERPLVLPLRTARTELEYTGRGTISMGRKWQGGDIRFASSVKSPRATTKIKGVNSMPIRRSQRRTVVFHRVVLKRKNKA